MSCKNHSNNDGHKHDTGGNHVSTKAANETVVDSQTDQQHADDEHGEELTLTQNQLDILNIKVDTISKRVMNGFVQVNGTLGVPPQNEAVVTSFLGANITSIKGVEGDKVKKGQVLAYISHPSIITMQTDYLQTYNKLTF